MRNVINTTANVTTTAIVNRTVRTVLVGVDAARAASLRYLRLFAAPAPQHWAPAKCHQAFAGQQKPAGMGPMSGASDLSRSCLRESSRCRRSRVRSCIERS
jgi:hypothetical protein